ncbi:hypothetical protein [Microbulbifer sp. SSSA005]|uniref:hypothetical protein n=1 Tax=Microbulbifer sp. SSSA005 TaxID=3243378 RepID=UPI00403A5224
MNKSLNLHLTMAGRYRLRARSRDGRERPLADWFPNLITNNGLDLLAASGTLEGSYSAIGGVAVGTGNTTPSESDAQLASHRAFVRDSTSENTNINSTDRYLAVTKTWQFDPGEADGNITEIGVGENYNNLFSRALIVDTDGNPTSITVLSDEYLIVSYELRFYQPVDDVVTTVDGYSITLRPASVNVTGASYWTATGFFIDAGAQSSQAHAAPLADIDNLPGSSHNRTSVTTDDYTPGSYSRTGTIHFDSTAANDTLEAFSFKFGPGRFQFSVSPAIVKTSLQEINIGVGVSWGRR